MIALEDFILQNTVWIVTIAIVFALALIGYIADSNGFLNKNKQPKKKNKKKNKNREEQPANELNQMLEEPETIEPVLPEENIVENEVEPTNTIEPDEPEKVEGSKQEDNESLSYNEISEPNSEDNIPLEDNNEVDTNDDIKDMDLIDKEVEIQPFDGELGVENAVPLIDEVPDEKVNDEDKSEPLEEPNEPVLENSENDSNAQASEEISNGEAVPIEENLDSQEDDTNQESLEEADIEKMNLPVEEENSNQEEVLEEQPKEEPAFDEDEILLDDKTRPLNIEKDFEKLLEEDEEVPDNDVVEKIDEDLWKF